MYLAPLGPLSPVGALEKPEHRPESLWPGNGGRGKQIMDRRFEFAHVDVAFEPGFGWHSAHAGDEWHRELHRFGWIRDVKMFSNTKLSAAVVREYLNTWLNEPPGADAIYNHPEIMGERLAHWVEHIMFLLAGADLTFRRRLLRHMARDALDLLQMVVDDDARVGVHTLKALIYTSTSLPQARFFMPHAMRALHAKIRDDIGPDGGHASLSPRVQMETVQTLVEMESALRRAGFHVPEWMEDAIQRTALYLRMVLHGDGALALFNDAVMGEPAHIRRVLGKAQPHYIPLPPVATSGMVRLHAGDARVFMQTDWPSASEIPTHYSPLALEFSDGPCRIITNIGAYRGDSVVWEGASRASAAHSMTVVDGMNAFARPMMSNSPAVEVRRINADNRLWIEARHYGYASTTGCIHTRTISLGGDGASLLGVDRVGVVDGVPQGLHTVDVRFHLHPDVRWNVVNDCAVRLALPLGQVWMFESSTPCMVEESVFLGFAGRPHPTGQIALRGVVEQNDAVLSWALSRIG